MARFGLQPTLAAIMAGLLPFVTAAAGIGSNQEMKTRKADTMQQAIDGLKPQPVWRYFAELSAIPRGSKHEAAAAAWVAATAKRLGHEAVQDACGNVLVRLDATPGCEKVPGIVLQSHLDMVCEKNAGTVHDFEKDPIVLKRQGDYITADNTTLGSDNGVGVAIELALLEEPPSRHGLIELLFTVDEETGLTGAHKLSPGILSSRILINLDSEEEGMLCVGCAGGMDSRGTLPLALTDVPAGHRFFTLRVTGLCGGHSGMDIHRGRANAIKLLARAVLALEPAGARLCAIEGGNKRNAIPREAWALITLPEAAAAGAAATCRELDAAFKSEYALTDATVSASIEPATAQARSLAPATQRALVDLLLALPHGVVAMNAAIPGLVETSTNLARVSMTGDTALIETSQRSPVESEKGAIVAAVSAAFRLAGANVSYSDGYFGWRPNLESPILKTAREVYKQKFGREPEVRAIHAGLECGIIGAKYPGMDMISMGPTLEMVHSPAERVRIDTVGKLWEYLRAIVEKIAS